MGCNGVPFGKDLRPFEMKKKKKSDIWYIPNLTNVLKAF